MTTTNTTKLNLTEFIESRWDLEAILDEFAVEVYENNPELHEDFSENEVASVLRKLFH